MQDDDPVHRVDANDKIVYINAAWREFAQRNGAPDLPGRVSGTSLWDHLSGGTVREVSKGLVASVRCSGNSLKLPFRCDAPDTRRFLEMELTPLGNGEVEFRSRVIRTEQRPPVPVPLEAEGTPLFLVCAWCMRFRCEDDWCEVEEAVQTLGVFNESQLKVSHGICEACLAEQHETLRQLRRPN